MKNDVIERIILGGSPKLTRELSRAFLKGNNGTSRTSLRLPLTQKSQTTIVLKPSISRKDAVELLDHFLLHAAKEPTTV